MRMSALLARLSVIATFQGILWEWVDYTYVIWFYRYQQSFASPNQSQRSLHLRPSWQDYSKLADLRDSRGREGSAAYLFSEVFMRLVPSFTEKICLHAVGGALTGFCVKNFARTTASKDKTLIQKVNVA